MDNPSILGHPLDQWKVEPPTIGPPLPKWMGIYWPWYKEEVPGVYTCPYCGATFSSQDELNQHIQIMHPTAPPVTYTCPYCGATFSSQDELNQHIQTMHPEVPTEGQITNLKVDSYDQSVAVGGACKVICSFDYQGPAVSKVLYAAIGNSGTFGFDEILKGQLTISIPQTTTLAKYTSQPVSIQITSAIDPAKSPYDLYAKVDSVISPYVTDAVTITGAPPSGATKFEYASDIRQETLPASGNKGAGIKFGVDIKNTGGATGTCHPIAYIETADGMETVDMGTTTINPGETVTFSGQWAPYAAYLADPDYWWRALRIESEAGIISFEAGQASVSVDIPARIQAGSTYSATAQVYLQYAAKRQYVFDVYLYFRGEVYENTPSIYYPNSAPHTVRTDPTLREAAVEAYIGASEVPTDLRSSGLLDSSRIYTITGVRQPGNFQPGYGIPNYYWEWVQGPANALWTWGNELQIKQILGYAPSGDIPLPSLKDAITGAVVKYDVVASLRYATLISGREFAGWYPLWSKKIGEVEVYGGPALEVIQKY